MMQIVRGIGALEALREMVYSGKRLDQIDIDLFDSGLNRIKQEMEIPE